MSVCVIKFSQILDNDMLIGTRKLSHIDRGGEFGRILSFESHQTTHQNTAAHNDTRPPSYAPCLLKCR